MTLTGVAQAKSEIQIFIIDNRFVLFVHIELLTLAVINVTGKKVKVKVTLEQATKAQRGSRGTAILFL